MGRIPTGVTTRPREDRRGRSYIVAVEIDLEHMRFGELFGFVTPLLVASALAPQLTHRSVSLLDRRMAALARPASVGGLALAGAILLAISSVLLRSGVAPKAPAVTPAAAIAAVRASHVEDPALNDYNFGGYLIFSGVEPFVDGRADLDGDAFMKRYVEAILRPSDQLLTEYGITWTIFLPQRPAVMLLDRLPGWRRLHADDIAVVHVRDDPSAR